MTMREATAPVKREAHQSITTTCGEAEARRLAGSDANTYAGRPFTPAAATMPSAPSEVTGLLKRWSAGDERARDQLIPLVYERLRELAHRRLQGARAEDSLNTTGLVHEAYIRLVDAPRVDLADRAHLLALVSEV